MLLHSRHEAHKGAVFREQRVSEGEAEHTHPWSVGQDIVYYYWMQQHNMKYCGLFQLWRKFLCSSAFYISSMSYKDSLNLQWLCTVRKYKKPQENIDAAEVISISIIFSSFPSPWHHLYILARNTVVSAVHQIFSINNLW